MKLLQYHSFLRKQKHGRGIHSFCFLILLQLTQTFLSLYAIQYYPPEEEARLENIGESSPIYKFYFLCVYNYEIGIKTTEQAPDIIFLISFSSCQLRRRNTRGKTWLVKNS